MIATLDTGASSFESVARRSQLRPDQSPNLAEQKQQRVPSSSAQLSPFSGDDTQALQAQTSRSTTRFTPSINHAESQNNDNHSPLKRLSSDNPLGQMFDVEA